MSSATPIPAMTNSVAKRLNRLRRRINFWFLLEGLSRLTACLLVILVLDVYIDWRFNLDGAQRLSMLVLGAIPLALVAYHYLLKPWLGLLSDDALCLEVERRNKHLGESLISAMQFSRSQGPELKFASAAMVHETIRQGVEGVRRIEFENVLDRSRLYLNGVLLSLCTLALAAGAMSVWFVPDMQTWFKRNILLLDQSWANHILFEFEGLENDELTVPYGSTWPFVVSMIDDIASMPDSMEFDVRQSGGTRIELAERIDRDRQFRVTLKQLTAPFEVRARAGRSRTEWHPVRPLQPPTTSLLELEIEPPKYSKLTRQKLPAGEGPYYVLKGSRLAIRGHTNKSIATASLVVGNTQHSMPLSGEDSFGLHLDSDSVTASIYRIELEDHERVWNPGTRRFMPLRSSDNLEFTLKYSPDVAPSVNAALEGISGMVLARARIPYRCSIEDDYGIVASRIKFEWRPDEEGSQIENRTSEILIPAETLGAKKVLFQDTMDLSTLNLAAGSGFSLEIEADDNDDIGGPKTGKSTKFLLRVVSENELRDNLLRREKELRQEFESVLKRQEDVLTDSEAFRAGLAESAELSASQRKLLMECQHNEKLLGPSVVSIASRLSSIIVETQNNRIEENGGPIEQRLGKQIVGPLRYLGEEILPSIARQFDVVRRQIDRIEERDAALEHAVVTERRAIATMKEILGFMMKSEGFQEAVNLLHQVQQEQRSVSDLTDREKRERVERLLDKTKK